MKKIIVLIIALSVCLFAQKEVLPTQTYIASGDVQDIVLDGELLYIATDVSKVDIYNINTNEMIKHIEIPKIKDFMGQDINAKIYSVDVLDGMVMFVSEGESGYRNLWIYTDEKLSQIINIQSKYFMRKAKFVDNSHILIALLTNDHILYDWKNKKAIYTTQLSTSSFSDFKLSEDKLTFVSSDESGIVRKVNTKSSRVLESYDGQNVDRVYQLDYKQGVILTAGQDRRAVVYKPYSSYYLQFDFLLYSCALSPSAKLVAVAYNIENDVLVYEVDSKNRLYSLTGARATITNILFINENEILVSSDSKQINYYKLK
ncbi:WD40 repeat domain-containing protein [Arcobacter sp. FWKO B]|uniref:WD40 repeat domain-containing protein n=1 Tax=Arcobacter sp. FWKO B TaxID=2593672 RepID=UPI0018A61367|nr:WD40 repeat domain-containing protein [Arcobacter sp. FWKO B]QOG11908.1 WD40 repeat domain-containing protein [Arcobacter sp. FWKO B]